MNAKNVKITWFVFIALVVFSFAFFSVADEKLNGKNIFLDADQDGLSDEEEKTYGTDPQNRDSDGDGYSDGAEVESGYDPLKSAPDDKIISDSGSEIIQENNATSDSEEAENSEENLTEEVSARIANLVSSTNSDDQEITLEDLDAIIQKSLSESLNIKDLPEVSEEEIKIKEQDYDDLSDEVRAKKEKEDAVKYLTAMVYIFASNMPYNISDTEDVEKIADEIQNEVSLLATTSFANLDYFKGLADRFEGILDQIYEIEVPENMLDVHIRGIKIAKYAVSLKNETEIDSEDPLKTIVKMSKVQSLLSLLMEFSEDINSRIKEMGIEDILLEI